MTVWGVEFYGQTTFVQQFVISSHLKPSLHMQRVFYLFGEEFNGHSWQTLLTEIDFGLQTHFPFYKISFLPHTKVQTPFKST